MVISVFWRERVERWEGREGRAGGRVEDGIFWWF